MRILVVDDEPAIRFALAELLTADRQAVAEAPSAAAALAACEREGFDLVFSDLRMPGGDGLGLLDALRARGDDALFVLVTAHGDERTAVTALKRGAWDYLPKPFDNDEVLALVRRARELLGLRAENERLRGAPRGGILGESAAIRELLRRLERVAPSDATVLILGESGTGKELVARALHEGSPRRRRAFVAVNCAALPGTLVEAELFGHVRGAFTGADRERRGVFEAADGGTLFLDEVGDLPPPAQAKLLRALEERRVTRIGSTREVPVDVRLLAATHRDVRELAHRGELRQDLLFRLEVVTLAVPPLRERRQDIPLLAAHFAGLLAARHGRPPRPFSEEARRRLEAHPFPGNVRELRNAVERAVLLGEGDELEAYDLPPTIGAASGAPPAGPAGPGRSLAELRRQADDRVTREAIVEALASHGSVSAAARALDLHRPTLQKLMRRLAVPSPSAETDLAAP